MAQTSKSFTSWRLFTPLVMLLGFALTSLGGAYLYQVQKEAWKEQVSYLSEKSLYEATLSWESTAKLAEHAVVLNPQELRSLLLDVPYILGLSVYDAQSGRVRTSYMREDKLYQASSLLGEVVSKGLVNTDDLTILSSGTAEQTSIYAVYKLHTGSAVLAEIDLPKFLQQSERDITNTGITVVVKNDAGTVLRDVVISDYAPNAAIAYDLVEYTNLGDVDWRIAKIYTPEFAGGVNILPTLLTAIVGVLLTLLISFTSLRHYKFSKFVHLEAETRTRELEQFISRFKAMNDNSYDLIAILTKAGEFEYLNSAYYRILKYNKSDLLGAKYVDFVRESDQSRVKTAIEQVLNGGMANDVQFRVADRKGVWCYMEGGFKPLLNDDGSIAGVVATCRDISMRRQYADDLTRSQQRFKDFADSSADWLWEVDVDNKFTYVSPGINLTLGYTPEEMLGRVKFDALFDKNNDMTRDLIESKVARQQPYRDIEFWTSSKTGDRVCLRLSGMPVFDDKDRYTGYRGAASNITASKLDRENMFRLATTDHLTGLLNRPRFTEELEQALSMSKRHKTEGVLIFIDLDQFKSVNDTHGHDAGDALIKAVSDILKDNVRSTDIVSRLGGDEFAVIMHNITVDEAKAKVQKIISAIDGLQIEYNDISLKCTMSIGMVAYPQDDKDTNSLMMSADLAMYRAKDMGRNRVFVEGDEDEGDVDMESRRHSLREQLKWVDRLRDALDGGDFEMYFQPLVPRADEKNPHFEALVRLRDENGQIGAPGIFIDAAEHFGLIRKLDMCVIKRCIEQQLEMKKKGYEADISINLSGKSLGDPKLLKELQAMLAEYEGLDPRNFTFEMTETAALHDPKEMADMDKIKDFIASMQALGFKFSLDDFGTGFSSFNYIKHLNVDCVKIDGSFILPLEHSEKDRLFVKAIVDLTKGLGMKTVAEFVENETILKVLDELGVDYAQGYHLSKPDPDLESLCKRFANKSMRDFE